MSESFWTDDRFAELKKLWDEGYSASQIARMMGAPSRNSILSKVHRTGLAARRVGCSPKMASNPSPRASKPYVPPPPAVEEPPAVTPEGSPITMSNVGFSQCRFPLWTDHGPLGDMPVCGNKVALGAYCEFHARKSYQPLPKRRGRTHDDDDVKRAKAALKGTGITRLFG